MSRAAKRDARARGSWQGMNWARPSLRLAVYLRDGMACVWCAAAVEEGTVLSLDHARPHSKGGTNAPRNLLTACKRCNDSRGARTLEAFADAVARYLNHGAQASAILAHVRACLKRDLKAYRQLALELLAHRGTVARALAARRAS